MASRHGAAGNAVESKEPGSVARTEYRALPGFNRARTTRHTGLYALNRTWSPDRAQQVTAPGAWVENRRAPDDSIRMYWQGSNGRERHQADGPLTGDRPMRGTKRPTRLT